MKKPKRNEPRRTEPWRGAPKHSDFKQQSPRKGGSRYAPPPKLNPVYQDPSTAGPPKDDPRYTGPRALNPVYQDPKAEPPRKPNPRFEHPNRVNPRKPEERYQHPGKPGSRKPDQRHSQGGRPGYQKPDQRHQNQRRPDQRFPAPPRVEPPAPSAPPAPVPQAAAPELAPNMIAGRNPVVEALRSETTLIEKVILLAGVKGDVIEKIRTLAKKRGVLCVEVGKQKFRELASDSITQGVVAIVGIKEYVDIVDILSAAQKRNEPPCILILDEIEDPHNLGALIRTAECAGIHGVVIPKHHAASVTQTVTKTSAGASEHMPVAKVVNIAQTLDALKKEGIWIVGTDDSAEQPYTKVDFSLPIAIVIGNEGKGIRQLVRDKCDFLVKIPLYGKIGSLNASVAGALVMYEMVRKRKAL